MADKLFGTDGVRGVANKELTPLLAYSLGVAAAKVLGRGHTPRFVVGRDTRISGTLLEAALSAGISAMGGEIVSADVVPTPAVASITRERGSDAGIVISASHNPFPDNGIKFFGPDGYKLDDALEAEIEAAVPGALAAVGPSGAGVGRILRDPSLASHYAAHLEETMGQVRLNGVKVVVDAANGANYKVGSAVLSDLGADLVCINCSPDGLNINDGCGSLHPAQMQALTLREGAAIGLAFDGDADRVMLSDENGRLIDGDRVMLIVGRHLANQGKLHGNTVVGTIMSNMGLEVALRERGLCLIRTAVGDRYVCEAMRRGGYTLGGEKSGHIIFGSLTTTGDGLLTALQVLKVMIETGQPLSRLADGMSEYPQILLGVRVRDRALWSHDSEIVGAIRGAETALSGQGRINVRASGTEKLVRVMVEGPDQGRIEAIARDIAGLIDRKTGEERS